MEAKLQAAKQRLWDVEVKLEEPVRQAVKAAGLVGVSVPEEYLTQVRRAPAKKANGTGKANGAYRWEPGALPNSDRTEDLTPQECAASRAMWSYSKGSKGAAGKRGEGVLTADEFWALVKAKTGKGELAPGEQVELVLPNGRPLKVTRLSPAQG